MSLITFLHLGEEKCPKCGVFGDKKKESRFVFFECPVCHTAFTNEIILNLGKDEIIENN